mmetsp:Transcript_91110/g.288612  ORF Transcript_91110/g.288612 Transcript_91110/m.288612 type:complete len:233 (-) Transcript_91110:26-724(-)
MGPPVLAHPARAVGADLQTAPALRPALGDLGRLARSAFSSKPWISAGEMLIRGSHGASPCRRLPRLLDGSLLGLHAHRLDHLQARALTGRQCPAIYSLHYLVVDPQVPAQGLHMGTAVRPPRKVDDEGLEARTQPRGGTPRAATVGNGMRAAAVGPEALEQMSSCPLRRIRRRAWAWGPVRQHSARRGRDTGSGGGDAAWILIQRWHQPPSRALCPTGWAMAIPVSSMLRAI